MAPAAATVPPPPQAAATTQAPPPPPQAAATVSFPQVMMAIMTAKRAGKDTDGILRRHGVHDLAIQLGTSTAATAELRAAVYAEIVA